MCDTDHRQAWARGGPSTQANLATLCRHHHRLKHAKDLDLNHHGNGAYTWTTPAGRTYHVPANTTHLLTVDQPNPPQETKERRR